MEFKRRRIESHSHWLDDDGIKIYTISVQDNAVDQSRFTERLTQMKARKPIAWQSTPAFAIFHEGANAPYLVLAWWGNDNELFIAVSAKIGSECIEDPLRFSFCIWDMEVLWNERNFFIETMYRTEPNLDEYRRRRFSNK